MPICPYGRCADKSCLLYESCRTKKPTPYDFAMKEIQKRLGFLMARLWCTWEIMDKIFPKIILQHPQQREECLGDLLEALRHSGFVADKGSEDPLMWEWKPGFDIRLKAACTEEDVV